MTKLKKFGVIGLLHCYNEISLSHVTDCVYLMLLQCVYKNTLFYMGEKNSLLQLRT